MPRPTRKKNQVSTWFDEVLREMRQGDIFEDKTAMATLDTVESLYPVLPPSKDGSEIEMNTADAGGGGYPSLQEYNYS